jgi:hypothetical protein
LTSLNSHLDELLAAMEKVSNCFKSVATSFQELAKRSINNKVLNKGYESLFNLFKTWSNDYLSQKSFIRDEIKYYYKFVNKEYNTFLKNYENYRLARDSYKRNFERMKKNKNPTKDDLFMLKDIKNYYGFELIHINDEYEKLEERMGKRLKKQFVKYYQNRDIIFQDYQKCCDLLKFQTNCFNEKLNKLESYINQYEEVLNQNNQNIADENNDNNDNEKNLEIIASSINNNEIKMLRDALRKISSLGYDLVDGLNITEEEKKVLSVILGENIENNINENKNEPDNGGEQEVEDNEVDKEDYDLSNQIVGLIERDVNDLYMRKLIEQVKIDQIDAITYSFKGNTKTKDVEFKIENGNLFCNTGESFTVWLISNFSL